LQECGATSYRTATNAAFNYSENCGRNTRTFRFLEVGPLSDAELTLRLAKTVDCDMDKRSVATYHFEMLIADEVVGGIRFRAGNGFDVETYAGNLGYNVAPSVPN
jgi:hypothetical protein